MNTLMLGEKAFENYLPVFSSGAKEIKEGAYNLHFWSLPFLGGLGGIKNTRKALIYLNFGKSYMVKTPIFVIVDL